ncbi:MAG TPA: tyrosine-type recombinase/integrase [Acidocella sp.]|jgi:integrase|uniref:tyrosine-type recombinase/integrase n=1 Tax=Acidocella sp. TaxID=50710 RepID=UPI002CD37F33|nr:tyrosine-type recombinase/integrase [Acidocella sp.]HVE20710.1 tyrosine-type recombinase/integrase [Acidocella sp.]
MARKVEKLSPAAVKNTNRPGMYGDGGGLWLHVGPNALDENGKPTKTGKSWIFRFMLDGKAREMGLGPLYTIGLSEARDRAQTCRKALLEGIDPLEVKHAKRKARKLEAAKAITFKDCAGKYIAANKAAWRNEKHVGQWENTLAAYVYPLIGGLAVSEIDTGHVTRVLEPIWTTKSETASRVRGRIESVLSYATTHGWRAGENPARWRGHLENVLPKKSKVAKVEHHAALPWRESGAFMKALATEQGTAALAFRFAILTAARTGEVIGARWSEIDLQHAVWTIPGERMKAGVEHRVPLSADAVVLLREAAKLLVDDAEFVFPGGKKDKPLSNMALLMTLRRMKRDDLTAHGFRSTFRDWAAETGQPADIAEAALAHTVGDKTVAAYQRGDLLDRRRKLMEAWAAFCSTVKNDGDSNG